MLLPAWPFETTSPHPNVLTLASTGQHRPCTTLSLLATPPLPLPYLFPELSAFATVADLVTHLRTSDARYRATVPPEFLPTNQPPMFITLYFIVTRLPDSLRSVRDHFLTLDPTSLTVDLLEQHLLAAETSAVAVGAARGTLRSPFFVGCFPSPLSPSFASAAAADISVHEDVGAASTSAMRRNSKGKGGRGSGGGSGGGGGGSGSGSGGSGRGGEGSGGGGGGGTGGGGGGPGGGGGGSEGSCGSRGSGISGGRSGPQRGGPGGGRGQQEQCRSETQTPQQLREWLVQRGAGEGSETCPYVIRTGAHAGRTCGRFHTEHRCFARLDDAWRTEFGDDVVRPRWAELLRSGVAIFDLDFDVIVSAMYALSFSAKGDCYWCVLPDPGIAAAALGASASGTPPGTAPAEALHTFTLDSGASRYFFRDSTTHTPLPAPVPVRLADPSGGPVIACSSTVLPCPAVPFGSLSGLHLPSFSTNLVSTAALQDGMVTTTTPGGQRVSICTCTRTGQHLATFTRRQGSSLYTVATEPPQVAASAQVSVSGQLAASCSFRLLSHQTLLWHHRLGHPSLLAFVACTPVSFKGEVSAVLIPWIHTVRLQLRERFGQDLPVLRLHSDRGGEFSSDLLRDFCRWEGILQSFTLPDSPQKNGIAEQRIGLVMETSPTLRWTGKVGDASVFRVRDSRTFVRDSFAYKLSARAIPCVFLGFVLDAPGWQFYHPTSRCVLPSQDVTFDESIPFYRLFPYRSAPSPPPPLFLAPGPPPVDPLPGTAPVLGAVLSSAAPGAAPSVASGGARSEGAGSGGAEPECLEYGGAESEGAEHGGAESRSAPWLSRDATARLAVCNHLPATECAHFGEHRTAQALYDVVVARYSSPATAALGRLLLPYLFLELSAFTTVADLVTHLRTSDARYRATVPAEFLPTNQTPMFITLYFIVTRLPDSLRSVRDHFLTLDPTSLTVDLLEQHLLAAETSAVADVGAASTSTKRCNSKGKGGWGVAIFDLDFDVIISAMYALSFSAEGDCYWCVAPNPGIAAAALGASASGTPPGTAPTEALHTFALDSGASRCLFRDSTTLTPLPAPVLTRLADPSRGPVVSSSSTVLPCLADAMVTTTTPGGQHVSICTCTRTGRHLATFTRRPGSSLYTLTTEPPQVAASAQVSESGQIAASCSCRLLSHQTLLWQHRLGHPSLPRLGGMHSRLLVSGLPKSLPPLAPSPAPPCLPCVETLMVEESSHSSLPPAHTSPP
ncbi:unnamed protein product [Closterium sp. NIES-54]